MFGNRTGPQEAAALWSMGRVKMRRQGPGHGVLFSHGVTCLGFIPSFCGNHWRVLNIKVIGYKLCLKKISLAAPM